METIKNYLDNIFQALPKTEEMLRLKADFLSDMEIKYHELRQMGKAENEAIGKVIGEFGNIDELLFEMGICATEKEAVPTVTMEGAREFLSASAKASCLVGIGVSTIIAGISIFIGLRDLLGDKLGELPIAILLLMIIPAVALFIYSGTLVDKFKFIEKGLFNLEYSAESILKAESAALKSKWTISIIIGVSLCIFSVALFIIISGFVNTYSLGISLFLTIIAIAVFIFIYSGSAASAYEKLLKTGDFNPKEQESARVIESVAGIIWPLAVCIFLVWGLMYDGWSISWIVFPITALLFGGFSAVYSSISKK